MNILATGAHFDDIELGCGATLRKLVDEGHKLYIFVGTTSGFVSATSYAPIRSEDRAREEGERSAALLDAVLICGDTPTFDLDFSHKLNTQITQLIERYQIDCVFTHWTHDPHHDHWGLAHAVLHGAKHVKRILAYQSSWYEADHSFSPNFYVDVTDYWQFKMDLLKVFQTEHSRVGHKWEQFCEASGRINGLKIGRPYAEGFQCIRWEY